MFKNLKNKKSSWILIILCTISQFLYYYFQSLNTTDRNVTTNELISCTNNKDLDSFNTTTSTFELSDDLLYNKTVKCVSKVKDKSNLSNDEQKELYNNNLNVGLIPLPNCVVKIKRMSTDENETRKLLKLSEASKIGNLSLENECEVIINISYRCSDYYYYEFWFYNFFLFIDKTQLSSNGAKLPNKKYFVPLLESDATKKSNCISLEKKSII